MERERISLKSANNDPAGFRFMRSLNQTERSILTKTLDMVKPHFPSNSEAIYWFSIYAHGKFANNDDFSFLATWVNQMVHEVSPDKEKVIIGYGFTINPKGNPAGQPFHIDYTATDSTIYIPMTQLTTKNSPQYLSIGLNNISLERAINPTGLDPKEIIAEEGLDFLEIKQIVSEPFVAFYMLPSTLHRGIPNTGDDDRILFWIELDDYEHEATEATAHEYSTETYKPVVKD